MKKKVKVHILPIEEVSVIFMSTRDKLLHYYFKGKKPNNAKFHNLYFTNDEKIEEGDWCILLENHYINGGVGKYNKKRAIGYGLHNTKFFRKIVATTDKSLNLPQIPQSFIKQYVEANGKIDEVEIEYTDWCDYDDDNTWGGLDNADLRIKVDSNNCVIVHSIKKFWTKEEVEDMLFDISTELCWDDKDEDELILNCQSKIKEIKENL